MAIIGLLESQMELLDQVEGDHWVPLFNYLASLTELPEKVVEKKVGSATGKVIPLQHIYNLCIPFFEAHQHIVDVHYCLAGEEIIHVCKPSTLSTLRPYDPEADVTIYNIEKADTEKLHLKAGAVALLFPEDAHQPLQEVPGVRHTDKLIVKMPLT